MLAEFEAEEASGKPYRSKALSDAGRAAFSKLMREAIIRGNEQTFITSLLDPNYWKSTETYARGGGIRTRTINVKQAAERLGITEFNIWYAHGFAKRLMDEGVTHCQVYRAANPKWEPSECSKHEGRVYLVKEIYDGHRARYWPEPGRSDILSIPFGPGCHHTIRRVAKEQS